MLPDQKVLGLPFRGWTVYELCSIVVHPRLAEYSLGPDNHRTTPAGDTFSEVATATEVVVDGRVRCGTHVRMDVH